MGSVPESQEELKQIFVAAYERGLRRIQAGQIDQLLQGLLYLHGDNVQNIVAYAGFRPSPDAQQPVRIEFRPRDGGQPEMVFRRTRNTDLRQDTDIGPLREYWDTQSERKVRSQVQDVFSGPGTDTIAALTAAVLARAAGAPPPTEAGLLLAASARSGHLEWVLNGVCQMLDEIRRTASRERIRFRDRLAAIREAGQKQPNSHRDLSGPER